ncbi:MAG: MBL fold metallo-hydrolase [Pseudomonadales bacterium]|jgi:ribonuclease Z|tara:strand:- start:143 stop:1189 length:1047 start_codon:yes stop_codon:yes gene_type:complete
MIKFLTYLVLSVIVLSGLLRYSLEFESAQDIAIEQVYRAGMSNAANGLPNPDSLRVFVCGSASPLGNTQRAQACIAVLTPSHFYIFDSGAGSTANISGAGLPYERLQGVFLTHFHSDHVAELYELNLASWVRGRSTAMNVYGPKGVAKVVSGINDTYELDVEYRVEHHGSDLLNPNLAKLKAETISAGVVLEDGDLTVTAYTASHAPIEPAVGYRIDYRGRSVVISGDSLVTDDTRRIASNVDLLLHDALSLPLTEAAAEAATTAGLTRLAKIISDVMDYHASTDSLIELGADTDAGMVAFYHLVPAPANLIMLKIFERNLPANFVLANDGDWFELPSDSADIIYTNQ